MLVNTRGQNLSYHRLGMRQFRFNADWCLENDCEKVIQEFWDNNSYNLLTKLELLRKKLIVWSSIVNRNRKT